MNWISGKKYVYYKIQKDVIVTHGNLFHYKSYNVPNFYVHIAFTSSTLNNSYSIMVSENFRRSYDLLHV